MQLSELKSLHVGQLLEMAIANEIEGANRLRKQELVFALLKNRAKKGEPIYGDGVMEVLPDGFGFLRSPDTSYLAGTDDIYVSPSQIRRFNLHTGDTVEGEIRTPKRRALLCAGEGGQGQLRAARGRQAQDPLREPHAAAPQPVPQARA
jgi:transcription termination factor Rho